MLAAKVKKQIVGFNEICSLLNEKKNRRKDRQGSWGDIWEKVIKEYMMC